MGALFAAVAGTIVVWILGIRGIPAHILCVTGGAFLGSWFFARRHEPKASTGGPAALARRSRQLMGIGSAAMGGALVNALGAYLIRLSVQRNIDLSAVGIYQATWVLCSIYVGFVLEAMGADFFPRLSRMQNDDEASCRIIREQIEVAVLLAFPGVLFLLVVAPWALEVLYAANFREGTTLMRWQLLGVAVRAISWPLGYLVLSRAMNWIFLATQVVFNVAYLAGAWLGMDRAGLEGVGAAFAFAYLVLLTVQWAIARLAIDFRLNWSVRATIGVSTTALLGAWAAFELAPTEWAYGLGMVALLLYSTWTVHRLLQRMNMTLREVGERVSSKLRYHRAQDPGIAAQRSALGGAEAFVDLGIAGNYDLVEPKEALGRGAASLANGVLRE
jgi:PST family polysaccharide transporter